MSNVFDMIKNYVDKSPQTYGEVLNNAVYGNQTPGMLSNNERQLYESINNADKRRLSNKENHDLSKSYKSNNGRLTFVSGIGNITQIC